MDLLNLKIYDESIAILFQWYVEESNKQPGDPGFLSVKERVGRIMLLLKRASGQDFGDDVQRYAHWFEVHADDWKNYRKDFGDARTIQI